MSTLPHCPRCGHAPHSATHHKGVLVTDGRHYAPWCEMCEFSLPTDEGGLFANREAANAAWTRAVRSELARQMLEMRAHASGRILTSTSGTSYSCPMTAESAQGHVMLDYIWRGENPLKLPGEE